MGRHPNERPFGVPFNGPVIPFGAKVEYHPITAKDLSRLHQFGPEVLPGLAKMLQISFLMGKPTTEHPALTRSESLSVETFKIYCLVGRHLMKASVCFPDAQANHIHETCQHLKL